MRRYLQGTLDFACGIYAVINALSCTHTIDLAAARSIFQSAFMDLAADPSLFKAFCRNETDHYWLVRGMLARIDTLHGYKLELVQPFSNCLLPGSNEEASLSKPILELFLPETEEPEGHPCLDAVRRESIAVWQTLAMWLDTPRKHRKKHAAIFRFHRFLPLVPGPVVSHWTTGYQIVNNTLHLHDASSEQGAIMEMPLDSLLPSNNSRPLLRIVPESLVLIATCK